jgi:hypothetical protein
MILDWLLDFSMFWKKALASGPSFGTILPSGNLIIATLFGKVLPDFLRTGCTVPVDLTGVTALFAD